MSKRVQPDYTPDERRKKRKIDALDPAFYQAKIDKRLAEIQDITGMFRAHQEEMFVRSLTWKRYIDSKLNAITGLLADGIFTPFDPVTAPQFPRDQLSGLLLERLGKVATGKSSVRPECRLVD